MKKTISIILAAIFVISMTFIAAGCKADTVVETIAAVTTAADISAAETTVAAETTEMENDIFSKPATIEFWWWGEEEAPGLSKYVDAMAQEYNKLHPNITVKPVLQSTADTIPAFQAAVAANSGPDIATCWYGMYNLETAVWPGAAAPLSDYIDKEELSHWIGKEIETYDGKVYGSNLFVEANVLIYNKEQYKAAGLDPENPPKTWDDFMTACQKLKEAGFAPFAAGFKGGWQFPILNYHILPQYLTAKEIKQAVVGERHFDEDIFLDSWEKIDAFARAGYFIEAATSIDFAEAYPEWRKGNGTHILMGSGQALSWLRELGAEKAGLMFFPQMTNNPVDWVPVMNQSEFITSWSPNKEIAADFLKFLHSDLSISKMIEMMDGNVIPGDDRFDTNTLSDPLQKRLADMIYSGYKNGKYFIDSFIPYPIMGDGMIPASQELVVQKITPEEGVKKTEEAAVTWREMNPEALAKYVKWAND